MKKRAKSVSRKSISICLSVLMLITSMVVGSISTAAATTWHDNWQTAQSNATIYFDNSITQWSTVNFRIGRNWDYGDPYKPKGSSSYAMTKVTGTDNIYSVSGIDWDHYNDFYFVNGGDTGWNNGTSIRTHLSYTAFTTPMNFNLGSGTYYFIGQSSTTGSDGSPAEVGCQGASGGSGATSSSDYTTYKKNIKNNSVDHGTVTVSYTDDSGTAQTIAEGNTASDILIGKKLTISMTADLGYAAGNATVTYAGNSASVSVANNGTTFTSGNTNTEVTGSFSLTDTLRTVTITAGEGGTVSKNSVTAGSIISGELGTATPSYGYKFNNWTGTSGLTITNSDNASTATVKATQNGTVTANFEADMSKNIYIVGRFRYRKTEGADFTYTGNTFGDWDNDSTKIKMTATSTDFVYKLETYSTITELAAKSSNNIIPYFHIKDGDNEFHPASDNIQMSTNKTTLGTSGSNNMYFSGSGTAGKVVIYFNTKTKQIWYELVYKVSAGTSTNGSIAFGTTASPTTSTSFYVPSGTTVYLANTPNTNYQLSYYQANSTSIGSVSSTTITTDTVLTGVFSKITRTVTVGSHTNGTLTVNGNSSSATVNQGESYTVVATPNDGYMLTALTAGSTSIIGDNANATTAVTVSRAMGTSNETVAATFTARTYTVSYSGTNVTYTNSPGTAEFGSTVTFEVNPPSAAYTMGSPIGTYIDKNGATQSLLITKVGNIYQFTQPAGNVTINTIANKAYYTATITAGANGSVSPSGNNVQINSSTGQDVSATPDPFYEFDEWVVTGDITKNGNDQVVNGVVTANFRATDDDGTITAKFKPIKYTVTSVSSNATMGSASPASSSTVSVVDAVQFTASPQTGYRFTNWTVVSGTVVVGSTDYTTGQTISNNADISVKAKANSSIRANFEAVPHSIAYSGAHSSYDANNPTSGTVGNEYSFKVKADLGYQITGVSASINGSAITVNANGTSSGYSVYKFTMPADSDSSHSVAVTTTTTAITPVVNVTYNTGESTTATQSSGSGYETSSRKSETISFNNANSYPSATAIKILDGDTELLSSTAGGTTSYSETLPVGSHTLKVQAVLDGVTLNSSTVTLTVNQSRTVTVSSPKYGGLAQYVYTNDFGTSNSISEPAADATNTIYLKSGTNLQVNKKSGAGILHKVYVDEVAQPNTNFAVSKNCNVTVRFRSSLKVMGLGSGWGYDDMSESRCLLYTDTANVLECKTFLPKATYENGTGFKLWNGVTGDSNWYGCNSEFSFAADTDTCTQTMATGNSYGNAKLCATAKGYYIFTFDTSTNALTIQLPDDSYLITYSDETTNHYSKGESLLSSKPNKTINLTLTPEDNYKITNVTVTEVDEETSTTSAVEVTRVNSTQYYFTMPDNPVTVNVTTEVYYEPNVTYYVDMHDNEVTDQKPVTLSIVSNGAGTGLKKDIDDNNCTVTLNSAQKQGDSTVYSAQMKTPCEKPSSTFLQLYIKVEYDSGNYVVTNFSSANVQNLVNSTSKEIWIEAANEESLTLTQPMATNNVSTYSFRTTADTRRIYLTKPLGWSSTDNDWENIGIIHDNQAATEGTHMTYFGADENSYYYYADIPENSETITFKAWGSNTSSGNTPLQTTGTLTIGENFFYALSKDGTDYVASEAANAMKRIYLSKPTSITDSDWNQIGVYYWGDFNDIGWQYGLHMKYFGTDGSNYYYYVDVPSFVNDLLFQGWKNRTSPGTNPGDKKTNNMEDIGNNNYFSLSKSGSSITASKEGAKSIPSFTRYCTSVAMNLNEVDASDTDTYVNIKPTTSCAVTFESADTHYVTVDADGNIFPQQSTGNNTVDITVKVKGALGELVTTETNAQANDYLTYKVPVRISDPSQFKGFDTMSIASSTSIIEIPTISSSQPGYFDSITSSVKGVANQKGDNATGYSNSAIITVKETTTVAGATKPIKYEVKYAAANNLFEGYSNINTKVNVVTKSIPYSGNNRYGHDHWEVNGTTSSELVASKKVTNGIEAATTKNIPLSNNTTYSAVFDEYPYVDVTFHYDYYDYKTTRTVEKKDGYGNTVYQQDGITPVTEEKEFYYYDPEYVGTDNRTASGFDASKHIAKSHDQTHFEIRNLTDSQVTAIMNGTGTQEQKDKLLNGAIQAIGNMPQSNYYDYTIDFGSLTVNSAGSFAADVNVAIKHTPKTYSVYLNGNEQTGTTYYYQTYAELNAPNSVDSKWYESDSEGTTQGTMLATGASYKFRVTGNTYLKTVANATDADKVNRSVVSHAGSEISYENETVNNVTTNKEYLYQNFYIADFFDVSKVLNPDSAYTEEGSSEIKYLPYDDVEFVGGGVMYYSVKNNVVNVNAQNAGYVDSEGNGVKSALKTAIMSHIEENKFDDSEVTLGDAETMKVAYGTEIAPTVEKINNRSTGLVYRYLPYREYIRENGSLQKVNGEYTFATEVNADVFRYSNSLQAYQYIYASKQENKDTNEGKNMRLYSYFVYSYTDYNKETNVPETKYDVIISDNYSDASTYWAHPGT